MMDMELEQMSETPTRRTHRRAQSETFFRLPDFDEDVVLDDFTFDFNDPNPNPNPNPRGFSLDADFFAGLDFANNNSLEPADSTKKAMPPHQLAHLALVDPKRAKRILANRQSASRSKERKIRYTGELERKVQTLQAEATTLSAEVTKLQRDTSGLTTENKELQLRLQAMEQAARLRDALNDALNEELKHLKIIVGEVQIDRGNNARQYAQFSFNSFNTPQTQYAQQQQQQQLHRPPPTSSKTDPEGALQPNFPGYN